MGRKMTPANLVVARAGGIRPLARLLEMDPSAIAKWINRGGRIPNSTRSGRESTHKRLLDLSKKHRWHLTAEELTFGGEP